MRDCAARDGLWLLMALAISGAANGSARDVKESDKLAVAARAN